MNKFIKVNLILFFMPISNEKFEKEGRKYEAKKQIISCLLEGRARVSEITEKVDRSQSTVSKYLQEYKEINIVAKDSDNKYYLVGLEGEEERLLSEIIERDLETKKEVSKAVKFSLNLETKLQKLIELNYLSGSPEEFNCTQKAYSYFGLSGRGKEFENSLIVNTFRHDMYSDYEVSTDPTENSGGKPADFLGFRLDLPSNPDICQHCGLPLNPKYIKAMLETHPEGDNDQLSESDEERLEEMLRELYGPAGSIYRMFRDYQGNNLEWTGKHYIHYKEDDKKYHPHCYKVVKEI